MANIDGISSEEMEKAQLDPVAFIKKWCFDNQRNWPNDPPQEKTFDGNDVIKMLNEFRSLG